MSSGIPFDVFIVGSAIVGIFAFDIGRRWWHGTAWKRRSPRRWLD